MSKLIEALQIFLKYNDSEYPTSCEHDALYILDIKPSDVTLKDKKKLEDLGFIVDDDNECFISFYFGSG